MATDSTTGDDDEDLIGKPIRFAREASSQGGKVNIATDVTGSLDYLSEGKSIGIEVDLSRAVGASITL